MVGPSLAIAQVPAGSDSTSVAPVALDERLLLAVYQVEQPVFCGAMRAADASAYPVFIGAPLLAWGAAALEGDRDYEAAYRLTVAEAVSFASASALKGLVGRRRPYVALAQVDARVKAVDRLLITEDASFPSGHATLAFALATSWSLSHSAWYVVAPSMTWATSIALSRVWLGAHYPSDVVAGALLGASVGVGVHLLRDTITPAFLEADEKTAAPMLRLRIPLNR